MKLSDGFGGVRKIIRRFPGPLVRSISKPMDEVLQFAVANARIQDFLDFPLHIVRDLYRRWRRLYSTREAILSMRLEKRHMEHRVNAHLCRELQSESEFA